MTENNAFQPFKPPILKKESEICILKQLNLTWGVNIWTRGIAHLVPTETALSIRKGSRLKLTFQSICMDLEVTGVNKPIIGNAPVTLQLSDPITTLDRQYAGFSDTQDMPLSEVLATYISDADIDSVLDRQKVPGVWIDGIYPCDIISTICSYTNTAFWRDTKGTLRIGNTDRTEPLYLDPVWMESVDDSYCWSRINSGTWPTPGQTVKVKNIEGTADRFELKYSNNSLETYAGFCMNPAPPVAIYASGVHPVQAEVIDPSGCLLKIISGNGQGQIILGKLIQTGLKAYKLDLPLEAGDRLTALLPCQGVHIGPVAVLPGQLSEPVEQLALKTAAFHMDFEQIQARFHKTSMCSCKKEISIMGNGIHLDPGSDKVRIKA